MVEILFWLRMGQEIVYEILTWRELSLQLRVGDEILLRWNFEFKILC